MLKISMLPASEGDALWIEWGYLAVPHKLLIDLGTQKSGKNILNIVKKLPIEERNFELLVITHVDRDHIGGTKTALIQAPENEGPRFKDIWFNGRIHLEGQSNCNHTDFEHFGAADGEELTAWLKQKPWNQSCQGEAILKNASGELYSHELSDGLKLTVIGPPQERLDEFLPHWNKEIKKALASGRLDEVPVGFESYGESLDDEDNWESYGRGVEPNLNDRNDLEQLSQYKENKTDDSHANGSSISLILEYQGKKVLLAGDAFASDLIDGLKAYAGELPLELDAFKVPHHGSLKNLTAELVKSVKCKNWLISTDGARFKHPDASSVARIIEHSIEEKPTIYFNVESDYNKWWSNLTWQNKFKYETKYGTKEKGLEIRFE